MTYHLDWTVFLFAHTISEVLDLVAFTLVFVAATQRAHVVRGDRVGPVTDRPHRFRRLGRGAGTATSSPSWRWPRRLLELRRRRQRQPGRDDSVDLPKSYKFAPAAITVTAGTTVTWTNDDNFTH